MRTMKAVQVTRAGGPLELVERDVPEPREGQVLVKVQACGICHSDMMTKEGLWPGLQYPRVPEHEIAGIVDSVGAGAEQWHRAHDRLAIARFRKRSQVHPLPNSTWQVRIR
jgi:D-arabinose 1-dehydrogenase-like Zn-dependent alcohol dehydrogenase